MSHFLFTVRLWAEKSRELMRMSCACRVTGRGESGREEEEEKLGGKIAVG